MGAQTRLTWDGWGRLSTTVGSNTVSCTYDPTCALLSRGSSSPASTTDYLLGDLFETNGSGVVTASYTDGPAGDLADYDGPPTGSSTVGFEYYDAHGNLVAEADSSGVVTASHGYDPFGAPLDAQPADATTYRFVGAWDKQLDTSSGLIRMGARPYDPATGCFLSVDPIPGGSLNNYDYAGQDPVNNYDLDGDSLVEVNPALDPGGGALYAPANDLGSGVGDGDVGRGGSGDAFTGEAPEWVQEGVKGKELPEKAGKGEVTQNGRGWRWNWGANGRTSSAFV